LKKNDAKLDDVPHSMAKNYEILQVNLSAEYLLPSILKKKTLLKKGVDLKMKKNYTSNYKRCTDC
jgi:hypothetical protein